MKNGLKALEIAEVKAINQSIRSRSDYESVISLLRGHMEEESTTLHSDHVSVGNEMCSN